ncbi:hypothetical protein [Pedobacter metabolipauper]|uniref:Outer membrane protein with beta-barrel domain n=1 Tax=Pedobacter metabolipauper TaxID=425513 RepID=A0A4R6T3C7_9SPHI|nr:hypothetical protein [Pedobacter metabolipauper]TDQ11871.1 hypothetical protein ATK78_1001 [Pedobacter metabolipauper]
MKYPLLTGMFLLFSFFSFSQTKVPDTLVMETKTGEKVILIGNDLNVFKNMKTDSLIRKALQAVEDSLMQRKLDTLKKKKLSMEERYYKVLKKHQIFAFQPLIGAGLIRDKVSPSLGLALDFAPQRQDYYSKLYPGFYTFINVAINACYLFDTDGADRHKTFSQIFVEASFGNRYNNKISNYQYQYFDELSIGLGYLVKQSGDYFEGNTFKLFGTIVPNNSFIRIKPELYLTHDFKKIFPGISVGIKLR